MAERKRRYRAGVKRTGNSALFANDGYVILDAPLRDVRLTEDAIRGVKLKYLADFTPPNRADKGRKMHSCEPPFDALGRPDTRTPTSR